MRKLLALVFFMSLAGLASAQISSFPYNEDFELESSTTASCGGTFTPVTAGWANTGTQTDWFADVGGTTSGSTGPSGPGGSTTGGTDHNPGTTTGIYMYLETSGSCNTQTGILQSPVFDFTSAASPQLDFWYHMYGATMGDLFFEVTTNAGATWTTLWSETGDQGNQWLNATISLAAYGGQAAVQFRFRGVTGTSFTSDMAIDDISIENIQPNNAGVSALVNPVQGGAAGLQNVEFTVNNYGSNAINTVNIEWEVNGTPQTPFAYAGPAIPAFGNTNVQVGNFNFAAGTTNIKAWTSLPNAVVDTDNGNDTLNTFFCTGLPAGTYTVGTPTSDFPTIDDAMIQMYSCGISGPVVFQVAPGLYNTYMNFDGQIPGASMTNTVTFDGGSASSTIIEHDATGANGNAVVSFDDASWVTIQNLTLRNTGTTDAWGVLFTNNSSHNVILNNMIEMYYASGVFDVIGVVAAADYLNDFAEGDNSFYNRVEGNTITGGEMGIHFEGSTANRNVGNQIYNNTIYGIDDYGIYMDDQDSIEINGNTIYDLRQTFADGIYLFDVMDFEIMSNNITAPDYGIYVSDGNFDAPPTRRAKIINNMASSEGIYTMFLDDFEEADVYHNTLYNRDLSTTSAALYINDQDDVNIVNNIFASDFGYTFRNADATAFNDMDHNLFWRYNPGTNYIQFGGTAYADLATWQGNTFGHGTNSVEGDPVFFAVNDLHVDGAAPNDAGDNSVGILVDIDGEGRPFTAATTVDIGADEYKPKDNDAGVVALVGPQSPLVAGFQPVTVTVRNFGLQDLVSFSVEWTYNGNMQGTIAYTGAPLAPQQETDITLGSINFPAGADADFVFWTTMPNAVMDERTSNDTLRVFLCPGLVGTYTVGTPTSDFATVQDAKDALYTCGVAGAVVFEVAAGTYTGPILQFTEEIPGASVTNTVTFDGMNAATLTHDGGQGANATVLLDAVDYLRIQNFSIETTGASGSDSWAVFLTNGANHNQILDNNISATFTSGIFDVSPIVISADIFNDFSEGDNANYTLIQGNTITGGEMGIHIEGSFSLRNKYNRIVNNTITGYDDYGIYLDDQDSIEIVGNTIENISVGSSFSDGIYCFDIMDFVIEGNNVRALDWGIYVSDGNFDGFVNRRGLVANNMVVAFDDAAYFDDFQYADIWHNSFKCEGTSTSSGMYVNDPLDLDIRNNIFTSDATNGYAFETPDNFSMLAMDHNVFYRASGTRHLLYGTGNIFTLANWQATGPFGYDQNSLDVDPQFVSATDLHIANINLNAAGDSVGVMMDIDDEVRPSIGTTLPDIGADEILVVADDAFPVSVAAPFNGSCESTTQQIDVILGNSGLNPITSANVTVNVSGIATGTFTGTYTGSIPSAGQDTVFNVGTINTTAGGQVCFEIITQMTGDGNVTNDTTNVCVNVAATVPTLVPDTTCVNTSAMLTSSPVGGITWYNAPAGGTALSTADTFVTPAILFTTTYYAEVTACGTTRYPVTANVTFPTPFNIGADTTICESSPLSLIAPSAAADYEWSTGETTQSISAGAAGTYSVTITQTNGCQPSGDITITNFAGPGLAAVLDTIACGNDQTGTIDLSLTGGTSPFSYAWSDGSTIEDPSGLMVGDYDVTVTDGNGCEFVESFPVAGPNPIIINAVVGGVSCSAGASGEIDLTVSGGAGGFNYTWSNGATNPDINGLATGTYTVTVTDIDGCSATQDVTVAQTPPVTIVVNNVVDESVDFGGSIDISYGGGVAPFYVVWNTGDTTEDLTNIVSGTYEVTIYDGAGCTYTETIDVDYTQPTNVEDVQGLNALNVFPNPTTDLVNIQLDLVEAQEVRVDIFNINGQLLQTLTPQDTAEQNYEVDFSNYSAGVYMARLIIGEDAVTTRIILQK